CAIGALSRFGRSVALATGMRRRVWRILSSLLILTSATTILFTPAIAGADILVDGQAIAGESWTLLPDGRWLIVGGRGPRGPLDAAAVCDPLTQTITWLRATLAQRRAWHSATTLADGMVVIAGGLGAQGIVTTLELFDPDAETFVPTVSWSRARAGHSATVLSDGRVLIAG